MKPFKFAVLSLPLASLALLSCTHVDRSDIQTEEQLKPGVSLLYKQCLSALLTGKYDEQALLDAGLAKIADDGNRVVFDYVPPETPEGDIKGIGLKLDYNSRKSKCEFSISPDGFSNTVPNLVEKARNDADMQDLFAQVSDFNEVRIETVRKGSQMRQYKTIVTLEMDD